MRFEIVMHYKTHFTDNSFDRSTYHIFGQLVTRQILDIFMLSVDDLRQLLPVYHFFVDPHVHHWVEAVGRFDILPNDFGNGRTPAGSEGGFRQPGRSPTQKPQAQTQGSERTTIKGKQMISDRIK